MNSHDSHDPDFPQDTPAIPEAEAMTPPDKSIEEPPLDAGGETAAPRHAPLTPDATTTESTGESEPEPPETTEEMSASSMPTASEADRDAEARSTSTTATPAMPIPAADVWTELDEAEPPTESWARREESTDWPQARAKERREPDPSGLDAGSESHREAEKPGRTVLPYDDWEPSEVPYQPKALGIIDQFMLVLADGATLWRKILRQVRSWLPKTWQRTLSDELMTAIALGVLILWLVLWNPLGRGSTAAQGATEGPERSSPELLQGEDTAASSTMIAGDSGPEGLPETLEPSPEQSLIADIQARVSKISRSYAVGLIQSVEVNLPQQVLAVNVSNDWYGLGAESQERIAQDIYTQAQGLAFAILQLRDPNGVVVARNPVVGTAMIILKRHQPMEGDPLAT